MDKRQACILTVDIGTSSTKVVAFDFEANEISFKRGLYPTFHPQSDVSEQDPEQVFITVLFLLKGLLNDATFSRKYHVQVIIFSSSMHSVIPVDKKGNALGNAIIWSDNRADAIARELKDSKYGKKIYMETGTPIHAMSPLSKVMWLRQNQKDILSKTTRYVSLKEYVIFQLCGEYVIDYSLASATGFFNLKNMKWNNDSMSVSGIKSTFFSEPVEIFYDGLKLKSEVRKSLKLEENTKIVIGGSDGCMASLCAGSFDPTQAIVSVTSSGAVRVFGDSFLTDENGGFFNYILTKGHYISGGPTNNGGVAVEWMAKNLNENANFETIADTVLHMQNEAAKIKAGSEGVLVIPYLQGERAPIWNSRARGSFFGLNITHEAAHMARACIEGVIYELYSIAAAIKSQREIKSIHLNGHQIAHPLWSRIVCDVFGLPVKVSPFRHSPNLGSALLGLTACGVFDDLEKAMATVKNNQEIYPSAQKHEEYQKYFELFSYLTEHFTAAFDIITKLQKES